MFFLLGAYTYTYMYPIYGVFCINFHEKKKTFGGLTQSNSIETVPSCVASLQCCWRHICIYFLIL